MSIIWAQATTSGLQAVGGYITASIRYKQQKKWQEYNNKMLNISNAMNQNAIIQNRAMKIQESALEAEQIQRKGLLGTGQVKVDAAASGTVGNSADMAKKAVLSAQGQAEYTRQENLKAAFLAASQQSQNSAMAAALQQDVSSKEAPSPFLYAMSFAGDLAGIAARHDFGGFDEAPSKGGYTTATGLNRNAGVPSIFTDITARQQAAKVR